jgi:CubicO group peptidase (beta-lactamase class C family)
VETRPTDAPMRMIDLLRHTSGLTYGFQMRTNVDAAYRSGKVEPFAEKEGGLQGFVDALAKVPLEFSPGTAWNYSVATDVLGYLVEQDLGPALRDFLQQRILGPLGMMDTAFHVPEDKVARFAQCYVRSRRAGAGAGLADLRRPASRPAPSGGGGLVSTAGRLPALLRVLRNGGALGGVRLLGPKTLQLMRANHLPGGRDLADSVGLDVLRGHLPRRRLRPGLRDDHRRGQAPAWPAATGRVLVGRPMASTAFWIDPVEDLSVVFLHPADPVPPPTRSAASCAPSESTRRMRRQQGSEVREFIEWARQNPCSMGTYAPGSVPHMVADQLNRSEGTKIQVVHYRGESPMWVDVASSNIQIAVGSYQAFNTVSTRGVKAIAVTGNYRSPKLPDVPTAMEQGVQGRLWSLEGGLPLMAPAGTPEAVLQALSRVVVQGADSERAAKLRESFAIPNKPKDLKGTRADWDRDVPVWVKLAVDLGIKLD